MPAATTPATAKKQISSKNILKSIFILASSSFAKIILTVIRTKALAVLLGPTGIGLAGTLNNLMLTATTFLNAGVATSATREVAKCPDGNISKLEKLKTLIIIVNLLLGVMATVAICVLAEPLATMVLGDKNSANLIRVLSVGVFFNISAWLQGALLNGLRRYKDLASVSVLSNIIGMIISVFLAWQLGEKGVVYYIISIPFIQFVITVVFTETKTNIGTTKISFSYFRKQSSGLLLLGIPLMASELITNLVMLAVRGQIANHLGLASVGMFQVAWAITGIYVGFALAAVKQEFFPRLTSIIDSSVDVNLSTNHQIKLMLWITTPLLLGLIVFTPIVVQLLYTKDFFVINDTLRYMALGTMFKVVAYTMSFIWLAKGAGKYAIADSLLWGGFFLLGVFFCNIIYGIELEMIGFIYISSYIFSMFYIRFFTGSITSFKFESRSLAELIVIVLAGIFCILVNNYFEQILSMLIGGVVFAIMTSRAIWLLYREYKN